MSTGVIIRAVELGLIFSVLSLGEYITVKVMDSPDLTVDGSFVTGGCTAAMLTLAGFPNLGLAAAFVAGLLCGCVTAFLQTKMKIQGLLAGILTMTALYSVNLRIMQGAQTHDPEQPGHGAVRAHCHRGADCPAHVRFLQDQPGPHAPGGRGQRGNDPVVFRECGFHEVPGIRPVQWPGGALRRAAGAVPEICGCDRRHRHAGIIIGEAVFRRSGIGFGLAASITGAILYRLLYTLALQLGFPATDMNLVSAVLVAVTISIPHLQKLKKKRGSHA